MEKKRFNFKEAKYKQIGDIYSKINTFFANVTNCLNVANLTAYQQQFNMIMDEAKKTMKEDKFQAFEQSNTQRWERIKKPFLPTKTPVQPTATQEQCNYIQEEKSAENRAEMMPDEKDKEIARLKQIIVNKDIIIQSLMKINNLQAN